jgi:hypothetical protein
MLLGLSFHQFQPKVFGQPVHGIEPKVLPAFHKAHDASAHYARFPLQFEVGGATFNDGSSQ